MSVIVVPSICFLGNALLRTYAHIFVVVDHVVGLSVCVWKRNSCADVEVVTDDTGGLDGTGEEEEACHGFDGAGLGLGFASLLRGMPKTWRKLLGVAAAFLPSSCLPKSSKTPFSSHPKNAFLRLKSEGLQRMVFYLKRVRRCFLPSCRWFPTSYSLGVGKGRLAVVKAVIWGFFICMPIYMRIISK